VTSPLSRGAAATALAAIGPVVYFSPTSLAVVAPLAALVLLFAVPRARLWGELRPRLLIAAAVLAAAAVAIPGALRPDWALERTLRLVPEAAAIGLLSVLLPRFGRAGGLAVAAGFGGGAALAIADLALGGVLSAWARSHGDLQSIRISYSRGAVAHALLLTPLAWWLWRERARRLGALFLVPGVIAITQLTSLSAQVAVATGVLVAALVWQWPRLVRVVAVVPAALLLVAPALPYQPTGPIGCLVAAAKPSALHRLHIWDHIAEKIPERVVFGHGVEAARFLPQGRETVVLATCDDPPVVVGQGERVPLHPHNAALQIWLELGLVGVIAMLVVLAAVGRALVAVEDRVARALSASLVAAAVAAALVSYGLWQNWWLMILGLIAAVQGLVAKPAPLRQSAAR
jgi:O-antigen ligase